MGVLWGAKLWEERYVRRMWPDEFAFLLDDAEEVDLHIPPVAHEEGSPGKTISRKALKVRIKPAGLRENLAACRGSLSVERQVCGQGHYADRQ